MSLWKIGGSCVWVSTHVLDLRAVQFILSDVRSLENKTVCESVELKRWKNIELIILVITFSLIVRLSSTNTRVQSNNIFVDDLKSIYQETDRSFRFESATQTVLSFLARIEKFLSVFFLKTQANIILFFFCWKQGIELLTIFAAALFNSVFWSQILLVLLFYD